MRHRGMQIGGSMVVLLIVVAVFAPLISSASPTEAVLRDRFTAPGTDGYLLGADQLGRDLWARVVWGARLSLVNGLGAVALGGIAGILLGAVAGFLGGWVDRVLMRVIDVLLAFPTLLLALFMVAFLGTGRVQTVLAIAVALIAPFARLARGEVMRVSQWEFVEGARALGMSGSRILMLHVLPNAMTPLLVYATLRLGTVILTEASLTFLGLGAMPPEPAWGLMVSEGLRFIRLAWWISIMPGIAILILVIATNLVGDALRDVLDPRTVTRG